MKTTFQAALIGAAIFPFAADLQAQCNFDPTVTGNLLLCPESTSVLGTQQYDAYQWYTRAYGDNGPAQPVNGATAPTFEVDAYETPVYVSVAATLAGCTEKSPEVLVDGLAFLPITVTSSGDYTVNFDGELVICSGDTVWLEALLPYTLNFKWYDDTEPVPGGNTSTLVVTTPGHYWLTASPGACPNWTATFGFQIAVIWGSGPGCVTAIEDPEPSLDVKILPNPASDRLQVLVADFASVDLRLIDARGKVVRERTFAEQTVMDVSDLPAGVYVLQLNSETGRAVKRIVVE